MSEGSKTRQRIVFPREVLLVEIERRCAVGQCSGRQRIGLTKGDARAYTGFECERCELWNDDALSERDIPEWWEELKITALDGVRPVKLGTMPESESGVVSRMSEAWRAERDRHEAGAAVENSDARGAVDNSSAGEDSF